MKTIDLGTIQLPANDFVERATGLIAKRGKGKSGLLKVIEEELLKLNLPFVIFDPTGIHWGIKSSFKGEKPSGFEVLVIGGKHGDLPLDRNAGRVVARALANTNLSLIVDFKGSSHAIYRQFVAEFSDELLDINGIPRLLIVEEAPRLLPQKLRPDQTQSFDAVARLILEGRNSGLGCILVSQRAATVNKDVLTQVDNLIVMGLTGPQDRKAIKEWVEENADASLINEFLSGLSGLQPREAWLWSPDMDLFDKFRVKDFKTFHPDRTHLRKLGLLESSAKVTDTKLLVDRLGKEIVQFSQEAKANDPKELKAKIAKLEKELSSRTVQSKPETKVEIREVEVFRNGELDRVEKIVKQLSDMSADLNDASRQFKDVILRSRQRMEKFDSRLKPQVKRVATLAKPTYSRNIPEPFSGNGKIPEGELKILTACGQYPDGASREQLTVLTGYKRSTRDAYIVRLGAKGFVFANNEGVFITELGLTELGDNFTPLPVGDELREYWMMKLPEGERKLLQVICEAYPNACERDYLTEQTGYQRSTRDAYLQRMGAKRLVNVTGRSQVTASQLLFSY